MFGRTHALADDEVETFYGHIALWSRISVHADRKREIPPCQ